jgi:hypothetical protein
MTDDAMQRRAAQVEQEARQRHGDEAWAASMRALEVKMRRGDISPSDLERKLARENAASQLFNENIGDADEKDWRAFRDNLPDRRRWRDRTGK